MAFDLVKFRDRFPEFRPAEDGVIESVADSAAMDIDTDVYRDKADEALLYLTAHKLALHPFARDLRLVDDAGQTVYWRDYQRIKQLVRQSFLVT